MTGVGHFETPGPVSSDDRDAPIPGHSKLRRVNGSDRPKRGFAPSASGKSLTGLNCDRKTRGGEPSTSPHNNLCTAVLSRFPEIMQLPIGVAASVAGARQVTYWMFVKRLFFR
jgi:hypothetical protein